MTSTRASTYQKVDDVTFDKKTDNSHRLFEAILWPFCKSDALWVSPRQLRTPHTNKQSCRCWQSLVAEMIMLRKNKEKRHLKALKRLPEHMPDPRLWHSCAECSPTMPNMCICTEVVTLMTGIQQSQVSEKSAFGGPKKVSAEDYSMIIHWLKSDFSPNWWKASTCSEIMGVPFLFP